MLFNKELYFYRKSGMCAKCFYLIFYSHVTVSQIPMFTWAAGKTAEIFVLGGDGG